VLFEFFL